MLWEGLKKVSSCMFACAALFFFFFLDCVRTLLLIDDVFQKSAVENMHISSVGTSEIPAVSIKYAVIGVDSTSL